MEVKNSIKIANLFDWLFFFGNQSHRLLFVVFLSLVGRPAVAE